ncbi:hypothetical protein HAX54_017989, partial [Datura stramonium]|nr:hypothetical protein [Datura stramonium]
QIFTSGHCLDPASHRLFADHDRRFADKSSVEKMPSQCSSYHWRFISSPQITSCVSPTFYECFYLILVITPL